MKLPASLQPAMNLNSVTTAWRRDESAADERLAEILDEYLAAIELGEPISIDELQRKHPRYATAIAEYLPGIDLLRPGGGEGFIDRRLEAADDVDAPKELGDYRIVGEIGRGGMGVVYEAQQLSLNRKVALKVLPFAAMLDARQILRFENEARAAAQLHHPNIVPVHGVGVDRGIHFYAMQFVEGRSLREAINELQVQRQSQHDSGCRFGSQNGKERSAERSRIKTVTRLGTQAAGALHAAHQCGVVHRDIKPSNLLLDAHGELWITDFGLARFQSEHDITRSGDIVGTLHYMSPEQIRADHVAVDGRSDVYSLAVTLYELFTLHRPFEGESHTDVLRKIEQGNCKPPRFYNPNIPVDLENVIVKAMSSSPSDRYESAQEFEADLQRFLAGEPTKARRVSMSQVVSKWAARNRTAVLASVVALCVFCVVLGTMTFSLWRSKVVADASKVVAEAKIDDLQAKLERFGLQFAETLKNYPGTEEERKELLDDLLKHYEDAIHSYDGDSTLQTDLAIALTQKARVLRELSEHQQAVATYEKAERILRQSSANEPENLEHKSRLAACLSNRGLITHELGRTRQAEAIMREAIDLQSDVVEQVANVEHFVALAKTYVNLGEVQQDLGAIDDSFRAAVGLFNRALGLEPDNEAVMHSLAVMCGNRCAQLASSNPHAALIYAKTAVRHGLELSKLQRNNREYAERLATDSGNLGTIYFATNELRPAIEAYRLAASWQRKLQRPGELVTTLCNLAKAQFAHGDVGDAVQTYQEAIGVQHTRIEAFPNDLHELSRMGALHHNLAYGLQAKGDLHLADSYYNSAIECQHRVLEMAPHIENYRDDLSRAYFNRARVSQKLNNPMLAVELQLQRAKLWPHDARQLRSTVSEIRRSLEAIPLADTRRTVVEERAQALLKLAQQVEGRMNSNSAAGENEASS